ncbi:MAG TPA: FHA domain-containing protein [Anaerolineales bacterium]|nr:FHA domain-containing protein [Anaerolineales bacterium]
MTALVVLALRFLLAGALYIFLAWALIILWQELRHQSLILSNRKRPGIHVGVRLQDGREFTYHFWQTEITVGRNSNCDISINDEALSAFHARISHHHGQWWLEDLNSTNGTLLNNVRLTVPAVLISEDQFQCGKTLFTVRIDPVEESPTPEKTSHFGGSK